MNIFLVSQCDKRALTETRRILDQFAERRGERVWQTPITQAGLDTLRKLLRKTARKNTAVACHWIRGLDHSELLWIVGDARQFNAEGAVPTNTTTHDVLRREDENDWHTLDIVRALAGLAALLHDMGKACVAFQNKLKQKDNFERNLFRHEWITLRLLQSFIGDDTENDECWLQRLLAVDPKNDTQWFDKLQCDNIMPNADKPFKRFPPVATAVAWLVLSHHRLPAMPGDEPKFFGGPIKGFRNHYLENVLSRVGPDWNELFIGKEYSAQSAKPYWTFTENLLPAHTDTWRKRAARHAKRLLELSRHPDFRNWAEDPFIMHHARLVLMLADHHYSARETNARLGEKDFPLHANTRKDKTSNRRTLNQRLDEHLLGVEKQARIIAHALPGFDRYLPRLARHRTLRKRATSEVFRWQDRAADLAAALRETAATQGAFIVNMASTGCGKTFANARILHALSDTVRGMRCAFALGLRVLTLQTGSNFRELLHLSDDELAIRTGGMANSELFNFYEREAETGGSASVRELLPEEDCHVLFEGDLSHSLLQRVFSEAPNHKTPAHALLAAPILVCTIDHLMPATESLSGGHQIVPMLRLMSGDLVLDELDDFDVDDLPALARLIYWAGMLGSRVLISSATLPPALVEGMFEAYHRGRAHFQRNRGEYPDKPPAIPAVWIDEFQQTHCNCIQVEAFSEAHKIFAQKRHARLANIAREEPRRRIGLIPFSPQGEEVSQREFAEKALAVALQLHEKHASNDTQSDRRISFGLIRMANIEPLYEVALHLFALGAPENHRIHLCVYHSQFPLLIRSRIENQLDRALNRRKPDAVFSLPEIRARIDGTREKHHLFIVLGSPVTEVGRDHDYDWAIVEPSSMRSLIQLAGRVRRHRQGACDFPNIFVFDTNLRFCKASRKPDDPIFCKPGFESPEYRLRAHSLETLLRPEERDAIDARPRILPYPEFSPDCPETYQNSLSGLEHKRLQAMCRWKDGDKLNACGLCVFPQAHLTAILSQRHPFRDDPIPDVDLALLMNEDETDYVLHMIRKVPRSREELFFPVEESKNHRIPDHRVQGERIESWGVFDYLATVFEQAAAMGMTPAECARRYGTLSLSGSSTQGWRFHPTLGFVKKK
jgi:CRISPR-associated endonuclease/helicase Cas3